MALPKHSLEYRAAGTAASPPAETGLRQRLLNTSASEGDLAVASELEAVANSDTSAGFSATSNAPLTVQMPQDLPSKPQLDTSTALEAPQEVDKGSEAVISPPEGATTNQSVLQVVEVTADHSTSTLSSSSDQTSPAPRMQGSI